MELEIKLDAMIGGFWFHIYLFIKFQRGSIKDGSSFKNFKSIKYQLKTI